MAILMRRGLEKDFDPSKMKVGEWAVSTDSKYVRMCFEPGICLRLATYEAFEADTDRFIKQMQSLLDEAKTVEEAVKLMQTTVEGLKVDVERYVESAKNYANASNSYSVQSKDYAEESKAYSEDSKKEADRAKTYAENASAVTGVEIATQTAAGIIKGGKNYIGEDGELILTKHTTTPTLPNSYHGGIKLNSLEGVSEQDKTSGAQLFDPVCNDITLSSYEVSENGYRITTKADEAVTSRALFDMDFLIGKSVTMQCDKIVVVSGNPSVAVARFRYVVDDSTSYASITPDNTSIDISFPENVTSVKLQIFGNGNTGYDARELEIYGFRITYTENKNLPWEPYTGRQPSPNPEYEQPIKRVKGKNLLDCRGLEEKEVNGGKFTPVYDENENLLYVEVNGTFTANSEYNIDGTLPYTGDYIVSGCPSGGNTSTTYNVVLYNTITWGNVVSTGAEQNVTVNNTSIQYRINILAGYTADHLRFYPMIRRASIADPTYVPYGCLRVWGHGEQLFDGELELGTFNSKGANQTSDVAVRSKNYIEVISGSTVTLSNDKGYANYIYEYDVNKNFISYSSSTAAKTLTLNENTKFVRFRTKTDSTQNDLTAKFMLNYGTEAKPYTPYTSQSIILSQPIELNGKGDVKDRIVRKDGVWGIERKFAEVMFDGSDDETISYFSIGENCVDVDYNIEKYDTNNYLARALLALSNRFTYAESGQAVGTFRYSTINNSGWNGNARMRFRLPLELNTKELVKEYFVSNTTKVVYEAKESTFEPLPTADQIALHSLMSFDGATYLYCDSEIQPTWDLEYGTSRVGAYTFESLNTAKRNEIAVKELTSAVLTMNQE